MECVRKICFSMNDQTKLHSIRFQPGAGRIKAQLEKTKKLNKMLHHYCVIYFLYCDFVHPDNFLHFLDSDLRITVILFCSFYVPGYVFRLVIFTFRVPVSIFSLCDAYYRMPDMDSTYQRLLCGFF